MREIAGLAWDRLKLVASIFGDYQGRIITTAFYFTILVPFGLGSHYLSDPLRMRSSGISDQWLERHPVSRELEAAKRQG